MTLKFQLTPDYLRLNTFIGSDGNDIVISDLGKSLVLAGSGDDTVETGRGADIVLADDGNDVVLGGRGADVLFGEDGDDSLFGDRGRDFLDGGDGADVMSGGRGADMLVGGAGADMIDGGRGADLISGGSGADTITTGKGRDTLLYDGDPFDGADVSAESRQIVGNEDFVTDFDQRRDKIAFDTEDFGLSDTLVFASLDGNAEGAALAEGTNVVVLQNGDNDGNPDTPFLAGTAANQIASLYDEGAEAEAGFFVYFNSNLQLNRLVYSEDLTDATADLKIINRFTDDLGDDALAQLQDWGADNFAFV